VSGTVLASWPTYHVGTILVGYGAVFGSLGALAWSYVRRGRTLARQVPDEDKPWT
jgi:hypothetical protein